MCSRTSNARRCAALVCAVAVLASPALAQDRAFDPFQAPAPDAAPATQTMPTGTATSQTSAATPVISSVEFTDTPVTTIFKLISDLTGWSIIVSPGVTAKPPKVSIWLKDMSADRAMQQVVDLAGLVTHRTGTTVEVMRFDEYARLKGLGQRVVQLRHARADEAMRLIEPLIDQDTARVIADRSSNQLLLIVPETQADALEAIAKSIDIPAESDTIEVVVLKHRKAAEIGPRLREFLSQSVGGSSDAATRGAAAPDAARAGARYVVQLMIEPSLNAVVLRGRPVDVQAAKELAVSLDVPDSTRVVGYTLKYTNASDAFATIKELFERGSRAGQTGDGAASSAPRIALSDSNNQIIVEGTLGDHARMEQMLAAIDRPAEQTAGGIRVYRLENATAEEVAQVLTDLTTPRGDGGSGATGDTSTPQPAFFQSDGSSAPGAPRSAVESRPIKITAAPEINAVLVDASAADQEQIASVIRSLDEPREQVMLEVTLVTVRSDKSFDLGVELSGASLNERGTSLISFTNFGIGAPDADGGGVRLNPNAALGLNFAVFNSDDFSVVLNALKTVGDTRISSTPRTLVQDNAKATISQVSQEPYATTSQGQSSTQTSFGGFIDAGTELVVSPHVSRAGWLRLEYEVNLSSFGTRTAQQLRDNLPPPRRRSSSQGTVRVPDQYTVVIGGLLSTLDSSTISGVPGLTDIPLVGELFKDRSKNHLTETLYIFIRPTIVKDPAYRDLLSLSQDDLQRARLFRTQGPDNAMKLLTPARPAVEEGGSR